MKALVEIADSLQGRVSQYRGKTLLVERAVTFFTADQLVKLGSELDLVPNGGGTAILRVGFHTITVLPGFFWVARGSKVATLYLAAAIILRRLPQVSLSPSRLLGCYRSLGGTLTGILPILLTRSPKLKAVPHRRYE